MSRRRQQQCLPWRISPVGKRAPAPACGEFRARKVPATQRIARMNASLTTTSEASIRTHPAWKTLETHYQKTSKLQLRALFADDPERGKRMCAEAVGIYLDYSKNRITDETIGLLIELAEQAALPA